MVRCTQNSQRRATCSDHKFSTSQIYRPIGKVSKCPPNPRICDQMSKSGVSNAVSVMFPSRVSSGAKSSVKRYVFRYRNSCRCRPVIIGCAASFLLQGFLLQYGHHWLCSILFVTGLFAAVWSSLAVQHPFCYRTICCRMAHLIPLLWYCLPLLSAPLSTLIFVTVKILCTILL